jgi:hypothetical protein
MTFGSTYLESQATARKLNVLHLRSGVEVPTLTDASVRQISDNKEISHLKTSAVIEITQGKRSARL